MVVGDKTAELTMVVLSSVVEMSSQKKKKKTLDRELSGGIMSEKDLCVCPVYMRDSKQWQGPQN